MHHDRCIGQSTLEDIRFVATFGDLIANTNRHFGNLAFFDRYDGKFSLAPVYDMLPMLYAPEHGQIIERAFSPASPSTQTIAVYERANSLAQQYWQRIAGDARVSAGFREISVANAVKVGA